MNFRTIALLGLLAPTVFANRFRKRHEDRSRSNNSHRQVLHNHQNVQYFADFQIGGQELTGIFDTGSFELLVRSSRCEHCIHPTPPYIEEKSISFVENGTLTQHVFGSGPCITKLGYETVSVGPLKAESQAFWEIVKHDIPIMNTAKFAAIVGIGPNFGFGNQEKTLLMNFGVTEFSICLQKSSGSDGFLTWGPEEKALSKKDIFTAKVTGKHHWETRMRDVHFDSKSSRDLLQKSKAKHAADAKEKAEKAKAQKAKKGNKTKVADEEEEAFDFPSIFKRPAVSAPCSNAQGCVAIVDSGTSLIAAPSEALYHLSEMVGEIKEDCSNLHELPALRFNLDGNIFDLPPQAWVMRITGATMEADNIWDILFFKPKIRKLDICMPAFTEMNMESPNGPMWILGMPFFRYYHTTFDRKNQEMRFAKAGKHCEALPLKAKDGKKSLLSVTTDEEAMEPLSIDIRSIIPPRLSLMVDETKRIMSEI
jgi:hypothetical protein